jgi:uncharacterized protein DUF3761
VRLLHAFVLAATLALPTRTVAVGPDLDSVQFTGSAIWLRAAPSLDAQPLALLPQGTQVRVITCARQTCRVGFRRLIGYVPQEILQKTAPAQRVDPGRGYINSRGQWIPSPSITADGKAPQGATARCEDGSYSFSQSARGTCSWHGGVVALTPDASH